MKSVGNLDLGEVFEDGALHGQFVKVGIEEGDDPLGERRGAVEVHYVATMWSCKFGVENTERGRREVGVQYVGRLTPPCRTS